MKKSAPWILLTVAAVGFAVISGFFIGRITAGDRIELGKYDIPTQTTDDPDDTDGLIDINTADIETLTLLPGIGETLAKRIIDYRESNGRFTEIEQLLNVTGIGEAKLEEIEHFIRIGDLK